MAFSKDATSYTATESGVLESGIPSFLSVASNQLLMMFLLVPLLYGNTGFPMFNVFDYFLGGMYLF